MPLEPRYVLLVAAGGALGATLRYLSVLAAEHLLDLRWAGLQVGTLAVNVIGSFLLGALLFHEIARGPENVGLLLFLGVGVLGAFTTMSSLSAETLIAWTQGRVWGGTLNAFLNLALSIAAAAAGRSAVLALPSGG